MPEKTSGCDKSDCLMTKPTEVACPDADCEAKTPAECEKADCPVEPAEDCSVPDCPAK